MSRFFLVAMGETAIVYAGRSELTFFNVENANPVSLAPAVPGESAARIPGLET
jgi:hypothetical protein